MKVVEVLWDDAFIDTCDISLKKARKLKPIRRSTVGFLVANNDTGLVLVTDKYEKDKKYVNTPMVIPHGMIVEWWEYK
jgi:hypothetical protein